MKLYSLLAGFISLLALTSCSSVRKLSDKDSRVSTTMSKKASSTAPREFLNIEVTPGGQARTRKR